MAGGLQHSKAWHGIAQSFRTAVHKTPQTCLQLKKKARHCQVETPIDMLLASVHIVSRHVMAWHGMA